MRDLGIVALSLWVGIMASVAVMVAPAAFGTLERGAAGRMMGAVFARYYWAGVVLGMVALGAMAARGWPRSGLAWGAVVLVTLMLILTAYGAIVLLPQIQGLSATAPAGSPDRAALSRLHRLAVVANGVAFLAAVAALVLEVARWRA